MKKALLLVSILFISVLTTACINNLAVQELNNKAAAFMEQGNYQEAIERLKSSIDLDSSLYESHYNLAVAYAQAEDYANAISSYEKTLQINPDFADAYYSLAVAQEDLAGGIVSGSICMDENGNFEKLEPVNYEEEDKKACPFDKNGKLYAEDLTKKAVQNYETYLDKNVSAPDKEDVENHIKELNMKLSLPQMEASAPASFAKD